MGVGGARPPPPPDSQSQRCDRFARFFFGIHLLRGAWAPFMRTIGSASPARKAGRPPLRHRSCSASSSSWWPSCCRPSRCASRSGSCRTSRSVGCFLRSFFETSFRKQQISLVDACFHRLLLTPPGVRVTACSGEQLQWCYFFFKKSQTPSKFVVGIVGFFDNFFQGRNLPVLINLKKLEIPKKIGRKE